jgi:MFS family permease
MQDSFFGRTVPNYFADKFGRFSVTVVMVLLSAIFVLGLWLPGRGNGALYAFAVLFGISSGAGIGLGPVLISSVSPMSELGTRMGIMLGAASFAILTSPPIAGAIVTAQGGSYTGACVFSGVSFAISASLMAYLRMNLSGWKFAAKA